MLKKVNAVWNRGSTLPPYTLGPKTLNTKPQGLPGTLTTYSFMGSFFFIKGVMAAKLWVKRVTGCYPETRNCNQRPF